MPDSLFHNINEYTIISEPNFSDEQNDMIKEFYKIIEKPDSWKYKRIKEILNEHDQKHRAELRQRVQNMLAESRRRRKKLMGLSL